MRSRWAKQDLAVDLAGTGLVATWVVGDLHVRDAREVAAQGRSELSLHALRVVDVVLDEEVVRAHLAGDRERLGGAAQVEAGDVPGVDRLDQELDARLLELACGEAQDADGGRARELVAHALRRQSP